MNPQQKIAVKVFKLALATPMLATLLGTSYLLAEDNKVTEPTREQLHFFENKIRPLLVERCYDCHSQDSGKSKGGLFWDTREGWMKGGDNGTALVPGDPEKSLFIKAIRYTDKDLQMPPKAKNRLSPEQVALFEEWVRMGAPDPRTATHKPDTSALNKERIKFWSFQPIQKPKLPPVRNTNWVSNGVDCFILAKLEELGMQPGPPADKRTLIRRAYFDLTGLPPTADQIDQFVNDKSPDAYERVVDTLLNSKQYGERWGRHWLDVARYADSGGYETDIYYRNAWRYRDYVVKSFNDDKPYNIFVQEQIAGDEFWPDDLGLTGSYDIPEEKKRHLEARIGTGFYALGTQIHESNMDAKKIRYENLTDWVDTTGAAFMGLTLGCARCHDHKFDPISQEDYYAMQAVFAGSREVEVPLITGMGIADFKQSYPRIIAVVEAKRAYRLFEERVKGRQPTEEEKKEKQRLLENVANMALSVPDGTAHDGPYDGIMEVPTATVLGHETAELIPVIKVLNRGELTRPRQKVEPGLPAVIRDATGWTTPMPGPYGSRKQLALWITDPEHPLTSRVMVNRLWHWHFGKGIAGTPNDFGKMGEKPTHAELLDWLAREFMKNGWSLKKMHKLMMLSSTYRMDSRYAPDANLKLDPANNHLWRMNRHRLEAETLWDAIHATAGTLNLKMGGRPVMPPLDKDEMAPGNWIVNADESEHTRRGIYILARRNFKFPMFDVFDSPVNAVSTGTRDTTTVAPQALYFLNNKSIYRQAKMFAARLVAKDSRSWNQPDFGKGQPGWEGAKAGKHAGWAKRVDNGHKPSGFDVPIGTVMTHGVTSVLLKIPSDDQGGEAKVTGALWNVRHLGRSGDWKLWKNDKELISEGTITDSSGSSSAPLSLAQGKSGGDKLEKIPVKGGDTFRLEIFDPDFVALKLTISVGKIYDLSEDFSLDSNPTPKGWQYSESLGNGGGTVGPAVRVTPGTGGGMANWVNQAWRIALGRSPTPEEKKESIELIEALARKEKTPLEDPPPALRDLPPGQAGALTKFCLALLNLDEFIYID